MADSYSVVVKLTGQNGLSAPVQQAQRSLQGLTQEAGRTNQAMSQLKMVGAGLFAGVTLAGVSRMAEDLYRTGMEAQRAGNLFRSFGAQIGDTNVLLEELRRATRGVVDDVSLMDGASRLLGMGIAKNAEDVTHLTSIAATFAQAMGTDVAGALEQVSLIISNESYLRLDSLGIGSGQVRELANQYKAAGMDSAAAFAQAFMDVADQKMPQMAAVADAAITPFQELQTSLSNFMNDFGNDFAYLVNQMAKGVRELAEAVGGIFGGRSGAPSGTDFAGAQAASGIYAQLFAASGVSAGSLSGQNISGALTAAILAQQAGMDMGSAGFMELLTQNAFGLSANDYSFNTETGQAMLQQAAGVVSWFNGYMGVVAEAERGITTFDGVRTATARPGLAAGDNANIRMGSMYSQYIFSVERQAQELQTLLGGSVTRGGLQIISPEAARTAENAAYAIETMVAALEGAGLESEFLAPLKAAAQASREGADAAAQWAENLRTASLSQLFGQTSGGRLGEIDAAVLGSLEAGGASQELLDAYRTAMGLDSGQLTAMSEQFDNEVVPFLEDIASQLGVDAYTRFRRAYEDAATHAAATGQATVNMADWAGGLTYYPGAGTGAGGSYTVQPGDTASAIAARFGVGVGDFGLANPSLIVPGQQLTWGGSGGGSGMLMDTGFDLLEQTMLNAETSMGNIETSATGVTDEMTTAVETLASGLDGVFAKTYQLPVELVISGGGLLGQLIAAAVSGNGGTTPGSSANTGRSGTAGGSGRGGRPLAIPS